MQELLQILRSAKCLTSREAPALHTALSEIVSARPGLMMPGVHVARSDLPFGAALQGKLIFTDHTFRLLDSDPATHITEDFKAVLGHEMHHVAHSASAIIGRLAPPLLLPAAAMVGVYLYDRAQAEKKEAKARGEIMDNPTALAAAYAHAKPGYDPRSPLDGKEQETLWDRIFQIGKYAAAGALGLGAGLLITRALNIRSEYRADAAGAAVAGGAHMAQALLKLEKGMEAYAEANPKQFTKRANPFLKFVIECLQAHPSTADRVARLRG